MAEPEIFTELLLSPQAIHGNLAVLTYKCAPLLSCSLHHGEGAEMTMLANVDMWHGHFIFCPAVMILFTLRRNLCFCSLSGSF